MATEQRTVLISGSSIGKGLLQHYLIQANTTVIAAVRNPSGKDAQNLFELPTGEKSRLITVKIDSALPYDARNAIAALQYQHEISHIDVVVACAGICDHLLPVSEIDVDELTRHMETNTYGVLRLFQATLPLLKAAKAPKFVCISSRLGSISLSAKDGAYTGTYGISKASVNYAVTKIGAENDWLVAFTIDPGFVQTDMGNRGAEFAGLDQAPNTVEESVEGIAKEIEDATREKCLGSFRTFDGETLPCFNYIALYASYLP
ncbi:hypothetical protein E8E13_001384 [Curvularia kusanoi]|uniref:Uncharacterized protein n=1 Tax=Curvularia kusanoi TaxID=90978 RepID=A0A9P4T555_CURKU|nr:hypothetical protein E8E13_001384 [Curvularia kusanoi]